MNAMLGWDELSEKEHKNLYKVFSEAIKAILEVSMDLRFELNDVAVFDDTHVNIMCNRVEFCPPPDGTTSEMIDSFSINNGEVVHHGSTYMDDNDMFLFIDNLDHILHDLRTGLSMSEKLNKLVKGEVEGVD